MIFVSFSMEKIIIPALTVPPFSQLTSYAATKSNFCLGNSLAAAVSDPVLYRLLTFYYVPNLLPLSRCLGRTEVSVQVRVFLFEHFVTRYFLRWGVSGTLPNPQSGGPPLFGCLRLLVRYIRSYRPYWRPFLHPHPEDAPCRRVRDPLITGKQRK